jgi:hypothetical protein
MFRDRQIHGMTAFNDEITLQKLFREEHFKRKAVCPLQE